MSTKDDLRQQAADSKEGYADIVNELTGKKPTEYEIQAADHFAQQTVIAQRPDFPDMTDEEAKRAVEAYKRLALRSGDLQALSDEMTADLKDPEHLKARQARERAEVVKENEESEKHGYGKLSKQAFIENAEKGMTLRDDLRLQAAAFKEECANIVNEHTGRKPTEYEIQAAEHFANQAVIAQRPDLPNMTDEEAKKAVDAYKRLALKYSDLQQLSDEMTADLKDPEHLKARQARDRAEVERQNEERARYARMNQARER